MSELLSFTRNYYNIHFSTLQNIILGTKTLNQGVQGSSPWRCIESTVFEVFMLWGRCFIFAISSPRSTTKPL